MSETKGLYEGLCSTCSNAIWCPTFAEWKCTEHLRRYPHAGAKECVDYKKRPAGWKEMPCRCEDCLKNEMLSEVEVGE